MFKCEDGFAYIRRFGSTISMEPQNVEENEENWYIISFYKHTYRTKWYDDYKIWNISISYGYRKNPYSLFISPLKQFKQ